MNPAAAITNRAAPKDRQMLEQIETTFQFLARELITSNEINERAPEATRLLCNEPLDWRKNCAKLVAAGLPVEIRPLDGATKISQEKLTVHLEPFGEGLFKTLSRVEPKRAPVFAATYVEDLADVGHGISWRPNEPTTYPPELDEPKVILTDELALACHGDVGRVLPSITDGAPTEEAVLLLTALVMELSGYMKAPRANVGDPDTARIERVRKAVARARKRQAA